MWLLSILDPRRAKVASSRQIKPIAVRTELFMIGEVHAVTNPALDVLNTDTNFRSVVCCGAVTAFVPVSDRPKPLDNIGRTDCLPVPLIGVQLSAGR